MTRPLVYGPFHRALKLNNWPHEYRLIFQEKPHLATRGLTPGWWSPVYQAASPSRCDSRGEGHTSIWSSEWLPPFCLISQSGEVPRWWALGLSGLSEGDMDLLRDSGSEALPNVEVKLMRPLLMLEVTFWITEISLSCENKTEAVRNLKDKRRGENLYYT